MTDDIVDKIKKYVKDTGTPLEIKATNLLLTHDWDIKNQYYYYDQQEDKARTLDIFAAKIFPFSGSILFDRFLIHLFIECKKCDYPWIFYTQPYEDEPDNLTGYMTYLKAIERPSDDKYKNRKLFELAQLSHYFRDFDKIGIIGDIAFRKDDLLYEACCQATKSIEYHMNLLRETVRSGLIKPYQLSYPIIVLDGRLFEIEIINNDVNVIETNYIRYVFSGVTEERSTYLIEIVHVDYLDEFLQKIEEEIQSTKWYIDNKLVSY